MSIASASQKRTTLTVLVRPDVRQSVVELADREKRSMARIVEFLLDEALAARKSKGE
jgi:hypothetical protein